MEPDKTTEEWQARQSEIDEQERQDELEDTCMFRKPLLGVMPRYIWEEQRMQALIGAINRATNAKTEIYIEWVKEYNELRRNHERYIEV